MPRCPPHLTTPSWVGASRATIAADATFVNRRAGRQRPERERATQEQAAGDVARRMDAAELEEQRDGADRRDRGGTGARPEAHGDDAEEQRAQRVPARIGRVEADEPLEMPA